MLPLLVLLLPILVRQVHILVPVPVSLLLFSFFFIELFVGFLAAAGAAGFFTFPFDSSVSIGFLRADAYFERASSLSSLLHI